VLAAVGLLHGVLLFYGDILLLYAACGLLVVAFLKLSHEKLLLMLKVFWGLAFLVSLLQGAFLALIGWFADWVGPELFVEETGLSAPVYQTAGFLAQIPTRMLDFLTQVLSLSMFLPLVVALMLTGLYVQRTALHPHLSDPRWTRVIRLAWLIGLPSAAVSALLYSIAIETFGSIMLASGWAVPLMLLGRCSAPVTRTFFCAMRRIGASLSLSRLGKWALSKCAGTNRQSVRGASPRQQKE